MHVLLDIILNIYISHQFSRVAILVVLKAGFSCFSSSQVDSPKTFRALKVVARAISSGVLLRYADIISTVTGREQGSFLWNVQYRWRKV